MSISGQFLIMHVIVELDSSPFQRNSHLEELGVRHRCGSGVRRSRGLRIASGVAYRIRWLHKTLSCLKSY